MVKIKPFRGLRYNYKLRAEIGSNVCPPFDVFEYGSDTDKTLKSIPNNFSHIIKPDGEGDEKYGNAKNYLLDLLKKRVLIREKKDAVYVYQQSYNEHSVTGLIAAVKLEDYKTGNILPHELTRTRPVEDRMKLLDSLKTNTGLIYTIFKGELPPMRGKLLFKFTDSYGVTNMLWVVKDPATIENVKREMHKKKLYIADGHHRYKTALEYAKKHDSSLSKEIPGNYFMTYMVPDTKALILPYNRVVFDVDEHTYDNLLSKIVDEFDVLETGDKTFYTPDQTRIILMYYKEKVYKLIPKGVFRNSPHKLDVTILQEKLLELILGFNREKLKSGEGIEYIHGWITPDKIPAIVDSKKNAVGFSLHPVKVQGVEAIADAIKDEKEFTMPPKWTFFYPKPYAGIVSYSLK